MTVEVLGADRFVVGVVPRTADVLGAGGTAGAAGEVVKAVGRTASGEAAGVLLAAVAEAAASRFMDLAG